MYGLLVNIDTDHRRLIYQFLEGSRAQVSRAKKDADLV